jgi:hypothetical protein
MEAEAAEEAELAIAVTMATSTVIEGDEVRDQTGVEEWATSCGDLVTKAS